MKASIEKLRRLTSHSRKVDARDKVETVAMAQTDELARAGKDMQDMRDCYDRLLSAAAATANSAYEFSESLGELGSCLEQVAPHNDEESSRILFMLGKVQIELQRLLDTYRSHIFKTITSPSEALLKDLRTVEDMKQQCDEKRNVFEMSLVKDKGRLRTNKGEKHIPPESRPAYIEYHDEATMCIFRLKSLKEGQARSLLTQAVRHHTAQVRLFHTGLKSLEAVEHQVKVAAEKQHIDCDLSVHGNKVEEDDDGDDGDDGRYISREGELSFDYGTNEKMDDTDLSVPCHSAARPAAVNANHREECPVSTSDQRMSSQRRRTNREGELSFDYGTNEKMDDTDLSVPCHSAARPAAVNANHREECPVSTSDQRMSSQRRRTNREGELSFDYGTNEKMDDTDLSVPCHSAARPAAVNANHREECPVSTSDQRMSSQRRRTNREGELSFDYGTNEKMDDTDLSVPCHSAARPAAVNANHREECPVSTSDQRMSSQRRRTNREGELSFDYGTNEKMDDTDLSVPCHSAARPAAVNANHREECPVSTSDQRMSSHSAPLFPEKKSDLSERLRQVNPSFNAYVLPTPNDSRYPKPVSQALNLTPANHIWHSSPLEPIIKSGKEAENNSLYDVSLALLQQTYIISKQ